MLIQPPLDTDAGQRKRNKGKGEAVCTPKFLIMQSFELQGLRQANIHVTKKQAEYKDNS